MSYLKCNGDVKVFANEFFWNKYNPKVLVLYGVQIQVPSLAPVIKAVPKWYSLFSSMLFKEKVRLDYHIR